MSTPPSDDAWRPPERGPGPYQPPYPGGSPVGPYDGPPAPPPPHYAGAYPAGPPPKKNRHVLRWVLLAVAAVAVAVIAAAAAANKPQTSTAPDPAPAAAGAAADKPAGLNTPVRDGQLEFTVTKVTCGIHQVGANDALTEKARGQFCRVALHVANIGDSRQDFISANQVMYVGGKKYSADDTATAYDTDGDILWALNPGLGANGAVLFDIPKNAKPASVELHDSALSGGASVLLR